MMKPSKFLIMLLIVSLGNIFNVIPAFALIPPLPSSFYGAVKVNGENVADGTMVKAVINGQVYATGYTQTYQGNSVYALDVPGDDSSTTTIEGGRDNDVIQFMVGETLAIETSVWKSATNVNVNLTLSATTPLNTPQATPTPVPTQTPIKLPKKIPTSTTSVELIATESVTYPTITLEPLPTRTHSSSQVQPQPTKSIGQPPDDTAVPVQVSPTEAGPLNSQGNGFGNTILLIVIVLIVVIIAVLSLRAYLQSSRSKER